MQPQQLKAILEALIMSSNTPLSVERLLAVFSEEERPEQQHLIEALYALQLEYEGKSIELKEVGSGFRFQVRKSYSDWVARLWEERPQRYSRALLETLALIAYKQPITRGDIEQIRGVAVNTQIIKTLLERDWIEIVGERDVPGRPSLYGTTKQFLDYFNLTSLAQLPELPPIRDLDQINAELNLEIPALLSVDTTVDTSQTAVGADTLAETAAAT
ncbi:MAG: SMC-Scp complex subunit ScpB [Gammaproteobacteria bacterium]|nr:SMC-Scp complex subunit ScpB [Gammaproteobacteria bacterium]